MKGYDEGTGFSDYPNLTMTLTVIEQHDRIFSGYVTFRTLSGEESRSGIAGAISRDGQTLTMVEEGSGYNTGIILSRDEIELTYINDGTPYSVAIDSFKRV
jgi:hypothetical protein